MDTHNARIEGTMLGIEDHGIMTFLLHLKLERYNVGWGQYALDQYDRETEKRKGWDEAAVILRNILEVVGVDTWENLSGKHIRVAGDIRLGHTIQAIGNIVEDKWFALQDSKPVKGTYAEVVL